MAHYFKLKLLKNTLFILELPPMWRDEFYSNKDILGSRRYSELAKWKFRDYNELSHFFEKRNHPLADPWAFDRVESLLRQASAAEGVETVRGLSAGSLVVFAGRQSLHRVSGSCTPFADLHASSLHFFFHSNHFFYFR